MEAETATDNEIKKIDNETIRLARKVMAGRACITDMDDQKKTHTNEWVRRRMGIYTTESELARRRVKWYKTMLTYPDENKLLRAALTGRMKLDEDEHTNFTPWIEMLMDDLSTLSEKLKVENVMENKLLEEIKIEGHHPNGEFIWQQHEILKWDEDKLRRYEQPEKRQRDDNNTDETKIVLEHECDICKYKGNKQQVAMRMSRTHNKRRKLINYVP